jgi:hypothetical protein
VAVHRRPREFWEGLIAEAERSSIDRTARRHRVRAKTLKVSMLRGT